MEKIVCMCSRIITTLDTQMQYWASDNVQALVDLKFRNKSLTQHEHKSVLIHLPVSYSLFMQRPLTKICNSNSSPHPHIASFSISNGFPKFQASQEAKDTLPI